MGNMERGANYPAVTDDDIKLQKLKVPNYQEQINISKKLDDLTSTINFIIKSKNEKITQLNLLKKSILQKIFNQETTIAA